MCARHADPRQPAQFSSKVDRSSLTAGNARRVRALIDAAELDAVVTARPEDVSYLVPEQAFCYRALAEGRMAEVVVLTATDDPVLFTMGAYVGYYETVGILARPLTELAAAIAGLRLSAAPRIAVPDDCPVAIHKLVFDASGAWPLDNDLVAEARLTKSEAEVALMRDACRIAELGMEAMRAACNVGVAECEVAAAGEWAMRSAGADALCFSTVVVGGPELGVMREYTSTRALAEGDWVMLDGGCTWNGYNAEFARSLRVSGDDEPFAAARRAVLDAQRAAIAAVRDGVSAAEPDRIARAVITDAGFGRDCYQHITGHGIGTGVWERPVLEQGADEVLRRGEIFSVEPGVFIPGVGGIRIEDLVLVTGNGAEVLTHTSAGNLKEA